MKIFLTVKGTGAWLALVVAVVWLTGCASFQKGVVLDTVGPSTALSLTENSTNGMLIVYSANDVGLTSDDSEFYNPRHSGYWILATDGTRLCFVRNDDGTILHGPESVTLSPGQYRVVAAANGYGQVTIPVIIVGKKNTAIHLEGGGAWPTGSGTNFVRLPDGQIVGWRGTEASVSQP